MTYIQPNANGSATSANSSPVVIASDQATVPVSVASIPSHAVTNAGTFAVQAAEADGANVTLGAKADAKNAATDTTAVSAMSVLKQISASVQAPPSQAVTNTGTFAVQNTQAGTASQNVAQLAGTTTDTNSGTKSAGTLRVVLATDQPALTNKLLVTPDSVALPANQSVNVSQVNGVTTLTGTGATGTGAQRVTVATDSATVAGSATLPTGTNSIGQVTANAGTNLNTSALALDATLTGGTAQTKLVKAVIPTATTMQNAATGNGNGTNLDVQGYSTAVLNITASVAMSGGTTINFEASVDDTTWVSIYGDPVSALTSPAISTTAVGDWTFSVAGYKSMRARISAYSAGTMTVKGYATVTNDTPIAVVSNLALNGTAVDANSGTKSAGTMRVVLATDQPALTNKLLVTPDSVALPANQSVNVSQLAGTTTDTNSGTKSAGTLRVVLATDQPALTNKLLVTPDSVALPANQSVNLSQVNGVTTLTGTGAQGTGAQRVTVATDSATVAGSASIPAGTNLMGKVGIDQTTNGTTNAVVPVPATAGGLTTYHLVSAGSTNATVVKAGVGQLYGWYIYNSNAAMRKVAFHNTASSPTAGASIFFTINIPPSAAANVFGDIGIPFSTGIAITTVTDLADNGTTAVAANDLTINLFYK